MTTPKPKTPAKVKAKASHQPSIRGAARKTGKYSYKDKATKVTAHKPKLKAGHEASPGSKPKPVAPLADDQLGPVPGIPTEAEIEQRVSSLGPPDRAIFGRIRQLVAQHLGSYAAARLWLVTAGEGYGETPLDTIREGHGKQVLEALTAQWGKNPTYA